MELRQLKYFVSAANCLNFTKAAKECYIVQSSMTEQIANLENELGVKLFDRQRKGLVLTEAGKYFLPRAKSILNETQKAVEEMSLFRGGYRSYLRVGYLGDLFKDDLIKALQKFRCEYPTAKIALRQLPQDMLIEGLRDGQFDVVLILDQEALEKENEWMETALLAKVGPMLVVEKEHPLAQLERITMEELKGLSYTNYENIGREELINSIGPLDTLMSKEGLSLDPSSNEILIASGYGVNLWPERLAQSGRYPKLRFVQIVDYPAKGDFLLAWRKGKLAPEGKTLCDLLCEGLQGDG